MPHMIPQYRKATAKSPMYDYPVNGEYWFTPDETPEFGTPYELHTSGYFYRLSAPGYLDCTDWTGPFPTLDAAKADCRDTFDVDPDSGEDLPEYDGIDDDMPDACVCCGISAPLNGGRCIRCTTDASTGSPEA